MNDCQTTTNPTSEKELNISFFFLEKFIKILEFRDFITFFSTKKKCQEEASINRTLSGEYSWVIRALLGA